MGVYCDHNDDDECMKLYPNELDLKFSNRCELRSTANGKMRTCGGLTKNQIKSNVALIRVVKPQPCIIKQVNMIFFKMTYESYENIQYSKMWKCIM